MEKTRDTLLRKIEKFCAEKNISVSAFGSASVGNDRLVAHLRAGRDVRTGTADDVMAYIAEHSSDPA